MLTTLTMSSGPAIGVTALIARESMDCLTAMLPERFISRFGHTAWLATPPELSEPDYSFWRHLKADVYVNNPATFREFRYEIRTIDKRL
jgi:hypothetical protein